MSRSFSWDLASVLSTPSLIGARSGSTITFVGGLTLAGFFVPMLLDGPMDGECESASSPDLRVADGPMFDGQFAAAYPAHLAPAPIRIGSNHRAEEADARLFSAVIEGAELEHLTGPSPRPELRLASEMFASVDFEASNNAQYLALISILELMTKPVNRHGVPTPIGEPSC